MKPLGTITKYYRFVDDETRQILDSLLESAYNYSNFVHLLVDRVCREDVSDTLVLLAAIHNLNLFEYKLFLDLSKRYREHLLVRPFILRLDAYFSEQPARHEEAKEAIEEVLTTNPEKWVAFRMHALAADIGDAVSPGGPYQQSAMRNLEELIHNDEFLSCFRHELVWCQSLQYVYIDNIKCIQIIEQAYEMALEIDDLVFAAQMMTSVAYHMGNIDTERAMTLSDKAIALGKQLGLTNMQGSVYAYRGAIHNARGEFDASVDCYLKCIQLMEKRGAPTASVLPHNLAWVYNEIGDGGVADEWASMGLATLKAQPRDFPLAYLDKARALISLGRLEEAREYLDEGQKMALKVGRELWIQSGYLTTGLLEMTEGRHLDAIQSFERSLEICQRVGKQNRINSSLLRLAECELTMLHVDEDIKHAEYSGPWMERLETEVTEKDLPGFRGLLLLLKAELRMKQGRRDEAEELMREVRTLSRQPGLNFLDNKVATLETLVDHVDS